MANPNLTLSLKQRRITVHFVGLVVSAAIATAGSLFCSTTSNEQQQWKNSILADSELLEQQSTLVAAGKITERDLHTMTQRLDEVTALIPVHPEKGQFLEQVSKLAAESVLIMQNFDPGSPEENDRVQRIRVLLTGEASYKGICAFLHGLKTLPRLTHVSDLHISPITTEGRHPVSMELSIFFAADSRSVVTRVAIHD
ncbi:MAG: type 4a pilus biogenesis protein PilO [Fuerstiella sp.]|nr:type 4a pilus biogenesis protein PilO [Fuerstiella sp.]